MTRQTQQEPEIIELKCWPISFQAIKSGKKRFEYRKNDRSYAVGKTLHQREYEPCYDEENDCLVSGGGYTGGELYHDIEWMIEGGVFGIPVGYCILSMSEPRNTRSLTDPPAPTDEQCRICSAATRNKARLDELTNLQDFREEEMKKIPFDPWFFINSENRRISNHINSLRAEANK